MVAPVAARGMSVEWYLAEFREEVGRFADAVGALSADAPVVTCPGWSAADLVRHVRQGHEWASTILEARSTTFIPPAGIVEGAGSWAEQVAAAGSGGGFPSDTTHWLSDGAQRLADAITAVPVDVTVWAPHGRQTVEFWPRWAMFETAVHRADACLAAGLPFTIDPAVALDCVDFCLIAFGEPDARPFLSPSFAEIPRDGQTLRFLTDTRSWLITCTPDGVQVDRDAPGPADVTTYATPAELALLVKTRISPDHPGVSVAGDRALLDFWLARAFC